MSTVRETINGHDWIPPIAYSTPVGGGRFEVGKIASCACGWESKQIDQLHCYAAFISHLSERMYAAIAVLDAAHREDAHEHGDGLVIIPDTPRKTVYNPHGDTGFEHAGCSYLAHGGTVCNKCGRYVPPSGKSRG